VADVILVPGDAPTIQGGIGMAQPGDSVLVSAGLYPEHVQLVSGVSVIGQDPVTTVIDGGDVAIDVVRAISVTNVLFRGFTVTGAISGGGLPGGAGVFVNFPSATVLIEEVIATGNDFGVAVFNSFNRSGPQITSCDIHDNGFFGVSDPGNGLLSRSIIYRNMHGINQAGNSSRPQIIGNTIWGNSGDGFNYWNDFAPTVRNNILAANGGYGIRERAPGTFVDPIVEFNLFWENIAGNYFDVQTQTAWNTAAEINALPNASDNLVDDPLLCDPPTDFHLCADSPAVGAGQGGATIGALEIGCDACGIAGVGAVEAPAAGLRLWSRPNPMTVSTEIAFELEGPGHAILRIWDVSGRAVRTLVDSPVPRGPFRVEWDGTTEGGARAPAGVYLLELRVNGAQVRSKVAVLSER
jgi:hypothetical protein